MDSLGRLTTPEEYINYYFEELKDEANKKNLQISKVGFLGYLLQIFGFTQYDSKTYYDYVLAESSPATADRYESQLMHASVYGYNISLAKQAELVGNFQFNLDFLPFLNNDIVKRDIYINDMEIAFGDVPYVLDSSYTLNIGIDSTTSVRTYSCQIVDDDGKVRTVPFLSTNPVVPIYDLNQYVEQTNNFTVGIYAYGSHYSTLVELEEEGSVSELRVFVLEDGETEYKEYDVEQVKYYSTGTDEVVFVKYLPDNKILLELGSGTKGKYIANSEIEVRIKITQGESGNISSQSQKPTAGSIVIYDTYSDGTISSGTTFDLKNFLTVNVDYGQYGKDPLDTDELRAAIIAYIRARDNLISESDFTDILDRYISDFLILFKKTNIFENVFYLYIPFTDKYLTPLESLSYSTLETTFNPTSATNIYHPQLTINGETFISPFLYIKDDFLNIYKGYLLKENYSSYFNLITREDGITEATLPLSLDISYDSTSGKTTIKVESYKSLSSYIFKLSISQLNISDVTMTHFDTNTIIYEYTTDNGVIYDEIDIVVEVYSSVEKLFEYQATDIELTIDVSEIVSLKKYTDVASNTYIIGIPMMLNSDFITDKTYYLNKFINTLTILNIDENRMISDEIQTRFINTSYVEDDILQEITTQNYNFDLTLPLKISFDLVGSTNYINTNDINVASSIRAFKIAVANELKSSYTGTQIVFYKTKMHDFAFDNLSWIKDVTITITDSDGTVIPNGNIETIQQKDVFEDLTKLQTALYMPMLWHWDVNDITVTYTLE